MSLEEPQDMQIEPHEDEVVASPSDHSTVVTTRLSHTPATRAPVEAESFTNLPIEACLAGNEPTVSQLLEQVQSMRLHQASSDKGADWNAFITQVLQPQHSLDTSTATTRDNAKTLRWIQWQTGLRLLGWTLGGSTFMERWARHLRRCHKKTCKKNKQKGQRNAKEQVLDDLLALLSQASFHTNDMAAFLHGSVRPLEKQSPELVREIYEHFELDSSSKQKSTNVMDLLSPRRKKRKQPSVDTQTTQHMLRPMATVPASPANSCLNATTSSLLPPAVEGFVPSAIPFTAPVSKNSLLLDSRARFVGSHFNTANTQTLFRQVPAAIPEPPPRSQPNFSRTNASFQTSKHMSCHLSSPRKRRRIVPETPLPDRQRHPQRTVHSMPPIPSPRSNARLVADALRAVRRQR